MRLLLVEDEPNAAHVLARGLREQAYAVDVAPDGDSALFQVGTADYDAVILDVMLPVKDGFGVCRAIRESGCAVPILMLTARYAIEARIHGLDSGADDYLVKPFDFRELLARLRALIRRGQRPLLPERMAVGSLMLETRSRRAHCDGVERTPLRRTKAAIAGEHFDLVSESGQACCSGGRQLGNPLDADDVMAQQPAADGRIPCRLR